MKNNFLKFGICILAAGTIFCSSIGFHKTVYGTDTKRSEDNSDNGIKESLNEISDTEIKRDPDSGINLDSFYISEDNYKENMNNIVMPYIENRMKSGYIDGIDNAKLYYELYNADDAKGNIVISHGYTESLEKYHEMIYYFLKSGYNVFGIEHRGHGRSGSLGVADKSQIYVNSFSDYIEDFKTFMDEVVVPNSNGMELYLYAHSMGGAIGSRFLEVYPQYFSKAVLNAPMMEVDTGNIPDFIAKVVVKAAVAFGQDGKYVIGKKPFSPCYSFDSVGTSSENRWTYINELINENEEIQRGEASYKWTDESFKVTKEITKKENASKVTIPILLFQAGDDAYVRPGGQNKFAEYAQNCELVKMDNAKHEIYLENDDIQKPYIKQLIEFYNN
jgi:lysophospholipase